MRTLRALLGSLLAGVLGALSLVVVTASPSFACSCARAGTAEYVDNAVAVFTGTVTDKEPPPKRPVMSSMDPVTYTFDVERSFKGDVASPTEVLSAMSGASCGLEGVRAGKRYVVFAHQGRSGDLWGSLCGGTAPWSAELEADVVAATGPGTPPADGADDPDDTADPPGVVTAGAGTAEPPEADPPAAEGGFIAVPVALAAGAGLVLLAGLLWLRLLLRR